MSTLSLFTGIAGYTAITGLTSYGKALKNRSRFPQPQSCFKMIEDLCFLALAETPDSLFCRRIEQQFMSPRTVCPRFSNQD